MEDSRAIDGGWASCISGTTSHAVGRSSPSFICISQAHTVSYLRITGLHSLRDPDHHRFASILESYLVLCFPSLFPYLLRQHYRSNPRNNDLIIQHASHLGIYCGSWWSICSAWRIWRACSIPPSPTWICIMGHRLKHLELDDIYSAPYCSRLEPQQLGYSLDLLRFFE